MTMMASRTLGTCSYGAMETDAQVLIVGMFKLLQVLTLVIAAVAFGAAFAHVLELPGKRRLDKEAYFTVQSIDYPGFTIGGVSEPVASERLRWSCVLLKDPSSRFIHPTRPGGAAADVAPTRRRAFGVYRRA